MENKKFAIKQGYVTREIAGEFIAVPVDSSCGTGVVILNPVSKLLWDEMRNEKTFDELIGTMLANYDIPREEAEADLKDFLAQLEQNGLLNA